MKRQSEGIIEQNKDIKRVFLPYTLLFCVFTAGIFAVLIISHRSFMQFHDAYKQGAFRLIEFRNQIDNILSGRGFSFWSWYEGTGLDEPLENFADPSSLIGALFPIRYLELGFTAAALIRMYLGGAAFLFMGREVGLKRNQNLTAAIVYTFSACFIGLALRQSEQLINAYLFPMLLASADRIYKRKSPLLFIITVSYYMVADIYFSYMSALIIVVYIVIRYFAYNEEFEIRDYLKTILSFIGYGIIGIMLSAFSSIFSAFTLMRASTGSSSEAQGLLFDSYHYLSLGKMLLGTGATFDYSDIGPHILIILLIPIAFRRISRSSTAAIMTIILFAVILCPFLCSMMNGFGYVSFRWTYALLLFSVWSAAEQFDADILKEKGNIALACVGLGIISIWTFVLYQAGVIEMSRTGRVFVPVQIISGAAIIALFVHIRKRGIISGKTNALLLGIILVSLSAGWSVGFANNIENFAKNSTVFNKLNESTLRAGREIEDEGFYRIDSVDGISRHADLKFPSNENIWWKTNNLFIYNSRIPQRVTDYNVDMGNSYGYARRVFVLSNGNRMGMDFLSGVRYFLGNDTKKEGFEDSDNYAGYGFYKEKEIDGVSVFRNKYDVGLGFVYDKVIPYADIESLSDAEKEQLMMQVAAVPVEEIEKCGKSALVKTDEIDAGVEEKEFELIEREGVSFEDGGFKTDKKNAYFIIEVQDVKDCQLMLSFDNLLHNSKNGDSGSSYEIFAESGKIKRTVINQKSRQGVSGLRNHSLNMGCYTEPEKVRIKVIIPAKGTYSYDKMYVSAMSTSVFDDAAEKRMAERLEVTDYNDKEVHGSVDAKKDGVLFLSIPAYDNWDVYVDGNKSDVIENLQGCYMGVALSKGKHSIMLKYNNRYVKGGTVLSIFALIMLVAVAIYRRRQNREG